MPCYNRAMGSVGAPVVRRIVQVARGPDTVDELLAGVGLSSVPSGAVWSDEAVDEDRYYSLLEQVGGERDLGLPFRYATALHVDDLGALGLGLKTAPTAGDALQRLVRYVLVLSDTLEYELVDGRAGPAFILTGRPHHRPGAALANECALAAVTSMLRQIVGSSLDPVQVSLRHLKPSTDRFHREYFGCRIVFGAPLDGLHLLPQQLDVPTRLADAGLSAFLLAQLDDIRARTADRSLVVSVESAVADALPDGQPSKSQIARRLGMSERTLHRRLAEEGESFQGLVTRTRRRSAEALLSSGQHGLADVAFLTGFSDQSAFSRAFKRWTGSTPAAFRRER